MIKKCFKCGTEFDAYSKWGEKKFCSRKCANSRTWSEEDKKKKSESGINFYKTNEGLKKKESLSKKQQGNTHNDSVKKQISTSLINFYNQNPEVRELIAERGRNRVVSSQTKEKLSKIAKQRGFGGHTSKKKIYFEKQNGEIVYLQSSYEIRCAEILEKLGVNWERPAPFIWYDKNGVDHRYYPDFKIGDLYIDTKNDYLIKKDADKIERVRKQNNIKLLILNEDKINENFIGSLV